MSDRNLRQASNAQLKRLRKLQKKKTRYNEEQFVVEGPRAVEQVVRNGKLTVKRLFFDEGVKMWHQEPWDGILEKIDGRLVESADFQGIVDTDNPQGVVAQVEMPPETSVDKLKGKDGVILAFDAIQDPGNLGTMIRSATWFGCSGLLVGKGTVDPFHPKVVRGTAGATGILDYSMRNLAENLTILTKEGWSVLVLELNDEATLLNSWKNKDKVVLVAGNEAHGIQPKVREKADSAVLVPDYKGGAQYLESLNVAVTVGISLYELTIG